MTAPPNGRSSGIARWSGVMLLLLLTGCTLRAQDLSNLRQRWVKPNNDTLRLDTLSIIPGSVVILKDGQPLDLDQYVLDPYRATLVVSTDADSVLVRYRVMPSSAWGCAAAQGHPDVANGERDPIEPFPL